MKVGELLHLLSDLPLDSEIKVFANEVFANVEQIEDVGWNTEHSCYVIHTWRD